MTKPNRKRLGWSLAGVLGIALVIAAIVAAPMQGVQTDGNVIPTARVAQGDVPVVVHATGELRPLKAQALVAPAVGGPMQILSIAATGTPVKEGDVIVEFDQSEQEERLDTARSELAQAEQEIAKMRADAVVQGAQDEVTLLTARFDVRRGELDVQGSELSSAIDKQKFVLTLEEAKGRLAQLQDDLKSRTASDRASLAVLEEKRNKARLQMDNAQRNIDNMKLRAPFDGLVAVKPNDMNNAAWAGVVVPEFRAGDTVFSGRPIAEVLHESGIELIAKVSEYDRAHLNAGQKAEVTIHAVQGKNAAGDHQGGGGRQPPRGVGVERSDADVRRQLRRDGQRIPPVCGRASRRRCASRARRSRTRCTCRARRSSNTTASRSCSSVRAARSSRAK